MRFVANLEPTCQPKALDITKEAKLFYDDALSRVTQFTNPLGVYTQTYDSVNLMPKTLTAPNGLTTTLDYHPAAADLRLKEIKHTLTGNVALSKHVYGYKPAGNIDSWAQTLGTNAAKTWAIAYDKADQLEAATQTQSGAVTAQQAFRFDRIGNITSKQDGSEISKGTFNNRNQLTAQEPGGWMRVRGTTNEGASVKVKSNANPFTNAATTSADEFSAWVQAAPGANTVTVEAKDDSPNANTRTQSWSVNITGQSRVPSYDLNGNMTANGLGQTYLWDAENRLVKITYADNSKTEFTYDGLSRRVRITERNASNTITSDKRYLWAGGNQPAEEREANGTTVTKRYFAQGEQRIGGSVAGFYYYTKDHLGSVREITNSSGALATRYEFDLWGKRTKLSGSMETEVGFTGHHHHAKSGLVLTWFRAYDAEAGRWLSPDPLGEAGGMNLYGYVLGDPINSWDPTGLASWQHHWEALGTWTLDEFEQSRNLGFMATADGFIPFKDPFKESGKYSDCDDGAQFSHAMGGIARDAAVALATGGGTTFANVAAQAKNPLLYELGSTTVSRGTWRFFKHTDVVTRGRILAAKHGGIVKAFAADSSFFRALPNIGSGLTRMARD